MTDSERKAVEAEPRIHTVCAVDDEGNRWTVWMRNPTGFPDDQTLRGWTVSRLVAFGPGYHETDMNEFLAHGLPAPETEAD